MTETKERKPFQILDGTALKIIAMLSMLIDHVGKTIFSFPDWMICVGRFAFPIFAFQIAEGYTHTKDFKSYVKRMFLFALLSEIPYNLMSGSLINPTSQNVLFTFCLALLLIRLIDQSWKKHWIYGILALVIGGTITYYAAFLLMVDYYGYGILMVLVFWLFHNIKFGWIFQLIAMVYINWEMIKGLNLIFMYHGEEIWVPVQAFAILAMIPILLYNGKKGAGGKKFQYAVYLFYPAHMLVLGLILWFLNTP